MGFNKSYRSLTKIISESCPPKSDTNNTQQLGCSDSWPKPNRIASNENEKDLGNRTRSSGKVRDRGIETLLKWCDHFYVTPIGVTTLGGQGGQGGRGGRGDRGGLCCRG